MEMAPGLLSLTPEHLLAWATKNTSSSLTGTGNPGGRGDAMGDGVGAGAAEAGEMPQAQLCFLHTTGDRLGQPAPQPNLIPREGTLLTTAPHHAHPAPRTGDSVT